MSISGDENKLEFQEVYTKTFKCEYQLQMYPFDTQVTCITLFKCRKDYIPYLLII